MSEQVKHTRRTKVRRANKRASYDRDQIIRLVEDVKLGHLAMVVDGEPLVMPITLWAHENNLYIHLANNNRIQRYLASGKQVCISICESKEWVLAKSAYHHSANYRSAVIYCSGTKVLDRNEFNQSFKTCINQIEADRWDKIRPPNDKEWKVTTLMRLTIDEGSFKSRSGGSIEEPEDLALPVENGVKAICPFHNWLLFKYILSFN